MSDTPDGVEPGSARPGRSKKDWAILIGVISLVVAVAGTAVTLWWPEYKESREIEPPTVPGSLEALNVHPRKLTLKWLASTDSGGSGLKAYAVYMDDKEIARVTENSKEVTGLQPQTKYLFKVRAEDRAGNKSDFSNTMTVTMPSGSGDNQPPTVPGAVNGAPVDATSVQLSWSASTDAGSGVDTYIIMQDGTEIARTPDTSFTVTGLAKNTAYAFTVKATDVDGNESEPSGPVNVSTMDTAVVTKTVNPPPPPPPPSAPAGLSVAARTAASITLTWAYADSVTYEVTDRGTLATTTQATYVSTGLSPATQYQYQVRAVDSRGRKSSWSAISASTTEPRDHTSGHVWMQPNAVEHLDQDQRSGSTQYDIVYAPDGSAFQAAYGAAYAPVPAGSGPGEYRTCRNAAGWKQTLAPAEFAPGKRVCIKTSLSRYGTLEFQTGPDGSVDVIFHIWREVPPDTAW